MKSTIIFLCFWLSTWLTTFAQTTASEITNENTPVDFSILNFNSKTQQNFNKKFKKYCKKYLIKPPNSYAYYKYVTFKTSSIDVTNANVKLSVERVKNVIADTNFCLTCRLAALQIIQRNFKEATFFSIDTVAVVNILMKTFLTDDDIGRWGAWRANHTTFGPYGYFLLNVGKDKAILPLFKQLNNKKKAPKCCYDIHYQRCAMYYELHTARHCDYAAVYLAHIINVPYVFKENSIEDDQEIANLIPKIQAYCAEKGISLE